MEAVTAARDIGERFQRALRARKAITIAKRAKGTAPIGRFFAYAFLHRWGVSQHFLTWDFIAQKRETEVAVAVLTVMNEEAIRGKRLWLG